MKIVFPYIAQFHQIPHSLPIAIELARRHPECEVHIAYPGERYLPFIQRLVNEYAPGVPLHFDCLRLDPINRARVASERLAWKQFALWLNRDYFNGFDAIATPERTSLFLRRIGVTRPKLIWTRHGAGDREIGFAKDVVKFDFVLMAGHRIEKRLLEKRLIRPGDYAVGVYAKFDWLRPGASAAPHLFDNDRPTVLYNPHFRGSLSSWPHFGMSVLEQFADSQRYNLIFAPHVRLFDPPRASNLKPFQRFVGLPHLHIDLGSERSIDMSYTRAADLYLGDVSSQVSEFVFRPRPCLFLNAHGVEWQRDPSYGFWQLGPVSNTAAAIEHQVSLAFDAHHDYLDVQRRYIDETFALPPGSCSAAGGAGAIVAFLRRSALRQTLTSVPRPPAPGPVAADALVGQIMDGNYDAASGRFGPSTMAPTVYASTVHVGQGDGPTVSAEAWAAALDAPPAAGTQDAPRRVPAALGIP
nr:hypothetical protein [Solimonas marina]